MSNLTSIIKPIEWERCIDDMLVPKADIIPYAIFIRANGKAFDLQLDRESVRFNTKQEAIEAAQKHWEASITPLLNLE